MSNLIFQNTELSVVSHKNQTYITSSDLAQALQYARPDSVNKIYERNQDEFTSGMVDHVKMALSGNLETTVRIFSLRGAHLIAMFARTPVAKEFRKWVLDILDKEVLQNSQQNLPLVDIEQDEEALHIIVNLFHSLNGAYDMGEKLRTQAPHLARQIDNEVGGYYIHNLNEPTAQALEKARKFVHAKSERIMFVKGMLSLLEEPKRLVHTNF